MAKYPIRGKVNELKLLAKLRKLGRRAAIAFKLSLKEVYVNEAVRANGAVGICHNNTIEIALRRADGKFLTWANILDTLAHEMAHLEIRSHGMPHSMFTYAILVFLQRQE